MHVPNCRTPLGSSPTSTNTSPAAVLRCLRAELQHREVVLRSAGASSLIEYQRLDDVAALPRLVLVVDEFASVAAELPEFLPSLVDIAQRGRSLGIHLVLATQRPAGVVDNKIRANTNLRIALRVQDDGDSLDVIGTKDAAQLPRRLPGRAYARAGCRRTHRCSSRRIRPA